MQVNAILSFHHLCDVISHYKLTRFEHILVISSLVSNQTRNISITIAILQSYIQKLVQGIY